MTRIVRESYPVADLPGDLRVGLPQDANVKVILELNPADAKGSEQPFSFKELYAMARPSFNSMEDVAEHVGKIREEWD